MFCFAFGVRYSSNCKVPSDKEPCPIHRPREGRTVRCYLYPFNQDTNQHDFISHEHMDKFYVNFFTKNHSDDFRTNGHTKILSVLPTPTNLSCSSICSFPKSQLNYTTILWLDLDLSTIFNTCFYRSYCNILEQGSTTFDSYQNNIPSRI